MSQLCLNTLPASKVTLISHECMSQVLKVYCAVSSVLHLVNGMECWVIKLCYFSNTQLGNSCLVGGRNFYPSDLQKKRLMSLENLLSRPIVALQFSSMEREISCVKQARMLSQNQIQEIVMDSDSNEDKYYASEDTEDKPRPPS